MTLLKDAPIGTTVRFALPEGFEVEGILEDAEVPFDTDSDFYVTLIDCTVTRRTVRHFDRTEILAPVDTVLR